MKTKRTIMIIAIILVIVLIGLVGFTIYQKATYKAQNPIATIEIKDLGTMKVELYPDQAPNTVANFIALANNGFYDGLTFHRIVKDFMVQGGDPSGDGSGGPTLDDLEPKEDDGNTIPTVEVPGVTDTENKYSIKGEFVQNGFTKNTLKHEKGVISMARSDYSGIGRTEDGYNSAGSQFFIMTGESANLNGYYAAFGKVIEGMEVVNEIVNTPVIRKDYSEELYKQIEDEGGQITTTETYNRYIQETNEMDRPVEAPVIKSMTVDTFGYEYGEPTKYNVE